MKNLNQKFSAIALILGVTLSSVAMVGCSSKKVQSEPTVAEQSVATPPVDLGRSSSGRAL